MRSRRWFAFLAFALLGGVAVAAASTINLAGSDSAPTVVVAAASCLTGEQLVPTVVEAGNVGDNGNGNGGGNGNGEGGNTKLTAVEVRGTYNKCAGSYMQVIVALSNGRLFYAVKPITDNSQSFTLSFDVHSGDFTDEAPIVVNGVLTPQGALVPPPPHKLVVDIQALVSNNWQ